MRKPTPQEARRRAADRRAQLAPLRKAVVAAEAEIERLARKIAAADKALADAALYTRDPAGAQALSRERGNLERARAAAEVKWLSASEDYELAEQATLQVDPATPGG